MKTTNSEYFDDFRSIERFFLYTSGGAFLFAISDDVNLIEKINADVHIALLGKHKHIQIHSFRQGQNDMLPIERIRQTLERYPNVDGLIFTNFEEELIRNPYLFIQLNFAREALLELNIPLMFWLSSNSNVIFQREAIDLYNRRALSTLNFNLTTPELEIANLSEQNKAKQLLKYNVSLRQDQSRLALLKNQLQESEEQKLPKISIANDIVLELLDIYNKMPGTKTDIKRLLRRYRRYISLRQPYNNFIMAETFSHIGEDTLAIDFYLAAIDQYKHSKKYGEVAKNQEFATTLNNLGNLYRRITQFEKAEIVYTQALGIYRNLAEISPKIFVPDLATILNNLGNLYRDMGEFAKASIAYNEASSFLRHLSIDNQEKQGTNAANSLYDYGSFKKTRDENSNSPIIVGLDIGTTKIVVIAGRKNEFGKLEILGFGRANSIGVQRGQVLNIDQTIKGIQSALASCVASNPDLKISEVYVGVAGHHIKSLQTRGDIVRQNPDTEIEQFEVNQLVENQRKTFIPAGDQIIDVIPQGFHVDNNHNITVPVGVNGVKLGANFHIITGDRNAIRNINRAVELSGLRTKDLVLQPLASASAVMSDIDLEAGVAVLDIGGGTSELAVFSEGILKHTAVIPFGGENITNDIRTGLGVLKIQAEQMKIQFGSALPAETKSNAVITIPGLKGMPAKEISVQTLSHIISRRMMEILEFVTYHLKQIDLDARLLSGGIILTGGGSQLMPFKTADRICYRAERTCGLS